MTGDSFCLGESKTRTGTRVQPCGKADANFPPTRMGAAFVHGAACTIHKAQGSQWQNVQVFAPDIYAASRAGRIEAGIPLWKRLTYVAITRAQERLHWVTRYRLARPEAALSTDDLQVAPVPLELAQEGEE